MSGNPSVLGKGLGGSFPLIGRSQDRLAVHFQDGPNGIDDPCLGMVFKEILNLGMAEEFIHCGQGSQNLLSIFGAHTF